MNRNFCIVWNAAVGAWSVASELTRKKGKQKVRGSGVHAAAIALVAGVFCVGASQSHAQAASGIGQLSLCDTTNSAGGYYGAASTTYAPSGCGSTSGPSFLLSNHGGLDGSSPPASTNIAQIYGNPDGTLVLQGQGGITLYGNTISTGTLSMSSQKILNLASGTIASTSTDAVNGSQLFGTNQSVANALGSTVAADGTIVAPSYTVQGQTYNNVSGAINGLDTALNTTNANVDNLSNQIMSGKVGLVQQAAAGQNLTVGKDTDGTAVDFTGTAGARRLTGVSAGALNAASTDAVNGSQLFGTNQSVANALGTTVAADGTIVAPSYTVQGQTYNNVSGAINGLDTALNTTNANVDNLSNQINSGKVGLVQQAAAGQNLTVGKDTDGTAVDFTGTAGARTLTGVSAGALSATSTEAVNGSQLYATNQAVAALESGNAGNSKGNDTSGLGGSQATGNDSSATGPGSMASGRKSTADGSGAVASGDHSTSTGGDSVAAGSNSTANGAGARATGDNGTALGANASASGAGSLAAGIGAQVSGLNSVALGSGAQAPADNSVALGANSVADRANSVSMGSAGAERQITNVAAGTAPTDAVNLGQLQQSQDWGKSYTDQQIRQQGKRIDASNSMNGAMTTMAASLNNIEKENRIGAGVGYSNGRSALAVGYQRAFSKNVNVTLGVSSSGSDTTVGAGIGMGF